MGLFDKVGAFLKLKAKDLDEAAEGVKDTPEQELAEGEHELAITPSQKIAILQQQVVSTDPRLGAIAVAAAGQAALAAAISEVGEVPADISLSDMTHLASGDEPDQRPDATGAVHTIPLVQAPTADELLKFDAPLTQPVKNELVAEEPTLSADSEETPASADPASSDYGKTPAELNYERARASVNSLLDELRGEAQDEGQT